MALRGHASIQGSTDISTLYDLLPGYLPQPACDEKHETLDGYCEMEGLPTGYWVHFKEFTVSLLKAWYGTEARTENDFRFQWLPRIDDDYSMVLYLDKMARGEVDGYFRLRAEPCRRNHQRQARPQGTAQFEMARRRRLVRDRNAPRSGATTPLARRPMKSEPRCSSFPPPRRRRKRAA